MKATFSSKEQQHQRQQQQQPLDNHSNNNNLQRKKSQKEEVRKMNRNRNIVSIGKKGVFTWLHAALDEVWKKGIRGARAKAECHRLIDEFVEKSNGGFVLFEKGNTQGMTLSPELVKACYVPVLLATTRKRAHKYRSRQTLDPCSIALPGTQTVPGMMVQGSKEDIVGTQTTTTNGRTKKEEDIPTPTATTTTPTTTATTETSEQSTAEMEAANSLLQMSLVTVANFPNKEAANSLPKMSLPTVTKKKQALTVNPQALRPRLSSRSKPSSFYRLRPRLTSNTSGKQKQKLSPSLKDTRGTRQPKTKQPTEQHKGSTWEEETVLKHKKTYESLVKEKRSKRNSLPAVHVAQGPPASVHTLPGVNASPTTRLLHRETLHQKWKWTNKKNLPWKNKEWVNTKVKILLEIKKIRKQLKINPPRMLWELWVKFDPPVDKKYLPRQFSSWSKAQKTEAIKELERQRLLMVMLATPLRNDELVMEKVVEQLRAGGLFSFEACRAAGIEKVAHAIRGAGMQTKTATSLVKAATVIKANGGVLKADGEWLMALHGVGHKICSVVMHSAFGTSWGIPVDSHAFGISRGDQMVNDGDTTEDRAAATLESWLPRHLWYQFNMELASLGQILDRDKENAQRFVNELLKSAVTRTWIVKICTSPLYVDRAAKFVQRAVKLDKSLSKYVLCKNKK